MAGQIRTRRTTWPRRSMQGGGWSSIAMACYSTRGAQLSSGLRCACHSSPQRPGTISNEVFPSLKICLDGLNVYRNNSAHHSRILLSERIESVALSSLRIL